MVKCKCEDKSEFAEVVSMENNIECLRCGQKMNYIRKGKIQLGQTGWLLGDLPNLLAGAMEVDIYTCPKCRKIEFYLANSEEGEVPQKQCPNCGKMHDFDYPKCPFCRYDYRYDY